MAKIKLPSYPLITIDPFMSIWSSAETLYGKDTQIWHGQRKSLHGTVFIDNIDSYCFMGIPEKGEAVIEQTDLDVTPLITTYVFQNQVLRLTVKFWTPLIIDDIYKLSLPVSFIDYEAEILDGKEHKISVGISISGEFCFKKRLGKLTFGTETLDETDAVFMGNKCQNPLNKSGDGVSADWGYVYLTGEKGCTSSGNLNSIYAESESLKYSFIFAYDDVKSIEYMGKQYPCIWKEKYGDILKVIEYARDSHDALLKDARRIENMILTDAEKFGESYKNILTASYRQILAGHKIFRDGNGEILYFSKECHSNGCINTVDVSYPALPLFLLYNPALVKGMMTGIFEFARMDAWSFDFAPHDIGRYPIANGQVYGHKISPFLPRCKIYLEKKCHCKFKSQMPIEECGNMLAMAYLHYRFTGDKSVIENNFDLLKKWADYLVNAGVVLENQLCTDDFAGHSEKNINLAIKSVLGITFFAEICKAMNKADSYTKLAKEYAQKLCSFALSDGTLPFSIGDSDTWSLKYNLVWDKIFGFALFPEELYEKESRKYKDKLDTYGVPLDYRKSLTKTDWMLLA
ncbi:MAG: DUF4965 domain-containing protein [Oscillospiraceae bacterium]|nr:DUF4965 domain-containing protein [Oscillospiraceae bacterium]